HHLLLAHGMAVQALRAELGGAGNIGLALNVNAIEPATDRAEDVAAAELLDGLWHRWYLDPLYKAAYPVDVQPALRMPAGLVRDADLAVIATPTDFLGVNYYTNYHPRAGRGGVSPEPALAPPRGPRTVMGWEVSPEGLDLVLRRLWRDYAPPRL